MKIHGRPVRSRRCRSAATTVDTAVEVVCGLVQCLLGIAAVCTTRDRRCYTTVVFLLRSQRRYYGQRLSFVVKTLLRAITATRDPNASHNINRNRRQTIATEVSLLLVKLSGARVVLLYVLSCLRGKKYRSEMFVPDVFMFCTISTPRRRCYQ